MAPRALPVSKLRTRRKKRRLLLAATIIVGLLILVAGLIGLAWLPFVRIHTLEVEGASSVATDVIENIVRADLTGSVALVLPKNSTFLFPESVIQKHLLEKFAAIESVQVQRKNLHTINVSVVERTTTALWCGKSHETASPCFLLDKGGAAYAPAADFSGEVYVKYYGPTTGSTVKQFLKPEEFYALSSLVGTLRAQIKDDAPARVEAVNGEVRITFESGFTLIYMLKDDGADVMERFMLALKADPFLHHTIADFSYLDLRFGDKLYYRQK